MAPFEIAFVSHPPSSVVAVWDEESALVQDTASPALMVTVDGPKAKSRIVTCAAATVAGSAAAQAPPAPCEAAAEALADGVGVAVPPQAATRTAAAASDPKTRWLPTMIPPAARPASGRYVPRYDRSAAAVSPLWCSGDGSSAGAAVAPVTPRWGSIRR